MRTLDKDSYWWKREEKEWVMQDKSGNWWIYKRKDEKVNTKTPEKRHRCLSNKFSWSEYALIVASGLLGISAALNLFFILS